MDQQTQLNLYHAASYISVVSVALMGIKEKNDTGEMLNELEVAGMRCMLRKSLDIIESLSA